MKRLASVLACILLGSAAAGALSIMSYNVQNLFDDVRNGTEYREFDPARSRWSTESFLLRVRALSEVVRKALPGGPDVLLLQEVENENALRVLLDKGLSGMGYAWHVIVPKKGLAANVAVVSRLPVTRVGTHNVHPWTDGAPVRDILEVRIETQGHVLFVFNNHWKSRTGGVKATEPSRRESAGVLSRRIAEILADDPLADIVAAGDFNESTDEFARARRARPTALMPADAPAGTEIDSALFLSAAAPQASSGTAAAHAPPFVLYDPWCETPAAQRGSAAWQGDWSTVDHILLSAGLFDRTGFRYRAGSFSALRLPFLLDSKGQPRGWDARAGGQGYSDHLPVTLTLDAD